MTPHLGLNTQRRYINVFGLRGGGRKLAGTEEKQDMYLHSLIMNYSGISQQ